MTSTAAREYKITLPRPHTGQQVVLNALSDPGTRFVWLDAGRRWFKTTLDMIWAIEGALAGEEVMWGAPVYDQARTGMEYTRYACRNHPLVEFNESRMEARFPGGGIIRWRSLDNPDNARSKTAHRVIIDEAADVPPSAWYEVLRPLLMTTRGKALINGTPNGRNWFWIELTKALAGESANAAAYVVPTLGAEIRDGQLVRVPHQMENPHIAWDEIEEMWRTLPERTFRQEVLGEFLDDAGGVFHNVRSCLVRDGRGLEERPHHPGAHRHIIGLDLAKHADFTVAVVLSLYEHRIVHVARWNQCDWPLTKARILLLSATWDHPTIWMDASHGSVGDPIYDDMARAGLRVEPFQFTAPTKKALIDNAVLVVEQGRVQIPDCDGSRVLVAELEAYQYERTAAGNLRMNAPEGMHDDCVIAFALACWPLSGEGGGLPREVVEYIAPSAFAPMASGEGRWARDAGAFAGMLNGGKRL